MLLMNDKLILNFYINLVFFVDRKIVKLFILWRNKKKNFGVDSVLVMMIIMSKMFFIFSDIL